MAITPPEYVGETSAALREIVADYGPAALSDPAMLSSLLADLLPGATRVARVLVAAAEDQVAETLAGHVARGLDAATAARLTASSFAAATMYAPEACEWVVGTLAIALGLITEATAASWSAQREPVRRARETRRPEPTSGRAAGTSPAGPARVAMTAYVANYRDGTVTPVSLAARTTGPAFRAGTWPSA